MKERFLQICVTSFFLAAVIVPIVCVGKNHSVVLFETNVEVLSRGEPTFLADCNEVSIFGLVQASILCEVGTTSNVVYPCVYTGNASFLIKKCVIGQ